MMSFAPLMHVVPSKVQKLTASVEPFQRLVPGVHSVLGQLCFSRSLAEILSLSWQALPRGPVLVGGLGR